MTLQIGSANARISLGIGYMEPLLQFAHAIKLAGGPKIAQPGQTPQWKPGRGRAPLMDSFALFCRNTLLGLGKTRWFRHHLY